MGDKRKALGTIIDKLGKLLAQRPTFSEVGATRIYCKPEDIVCAQLR
jgi:hypothetical protein